MNLKRNIASRFGLASSKRAQSKLGFLRSHRFLILRRLVQFGILILFTMPIFGFWILKGTLASSEFLNFIPLSDPFIFMQSLVSGHLYAGIGILGAFILSLTYWLLGGKSYCAWVCPINIVTDFAHWLRVKFKFKNHVSLPKNARFWIMIMVLIVSLISHTIAWELINPITGLFRTIVYLSLNLSSIGLMLALLVLILDTIVANRLWCGHLCPVGSFYKLLGTKTFLAIEAIHQDQCDDCADCYKVCPEHHVLKPALKTNAIRIQNADCTRCGRCIDVCHTNVLAFKWGPPNVHCNQTLNDLTTDTIHKHELNP